MNIKIWIALLIFFPFSNTSFASQKEGEEDKISSLNQNFARMSLEGTVPSTLRDDSQETPKKKNPHKKLQTDPVGKKAKSRISQNIKTKFYEQSKNVCKNFLNQDKENLGNISITPLFESFVEKYDQENPINSMLDITELSSRKRIALLVRIINYKVEKIPEYAYNVNNGDEFKYSEWGGNQWWTKELGKFDITDLVPTYFKIGSDRYYLQNGPTLHQKGSGRLFGIIDENKADTYETILRWLIQNKKNLKIFGERLIDNKKNGGALILKYKNGSNGSPAVEINRFLNGFNLLLDYEVARRRVDKDPYPDLPVLHGISYILKNFEDINFLKQCFSKGGLFQDEFKVIHRDDFIRNTLEQKNPISSRFIRNELKIFHKQDEDSEESYELFDSVNFLDPTILYTQGKQLLERGNTDNAAIAFLNIVHDGNLEHFESLKTILFLQDEEVNIKEDDYKGLYPLLSAFLVHFPEAFTRADTF